MDQAPKEEIDRSVSSMARTYRRRASKGVCRYCGETPRPGTQYCDRHHKTDYARVLNWMQSQREKGLCVRCAQKAVPGYARCQYHLDLAREYTERHRQKKLAAQNA